MRPRTKLQFQVIGLSQRLSNIETKMLSWAKVECLDHRGYATKKRVVCMDCGQTFSPELVKRKRAVCPDCNVKLKVERSRKTTDKQQTYIAIAEIHHEFQVIRNFELIAYYRAFEPPRYFIQEILQHWILPNGKREVIARNHTISWYVDSWNGDMAIRNKSIINTYDVYPYKLHPGSIFLPVLKRYGIDHKLKELTPFEAITHIPKNPKMETLLKAKQYHLLGYGKNNRYDINLHWPSIKICMRNKYIVRDAKTWIDYLDLLFYFNKDLRNAHYVCPDDLKKEHDKLVAKKRVILEKEAAERKRIKAIENEKRFRELKSKFFGLQFTDGLIRVRMLESVQEFMQEGDIMHHCVFTNEYYLKPNSLIFSAMIKDKHIETVEVDLTTLEVVQSRGACNQNTEFHDRIIQLMKKNINLIRQKMTA